jgi:hypothetical protein
MHCFLFKHYILELCNVGGLTAALVVSNISLMLKHTRILYKTGLTSHGKKEVIKVMLAASMCTPWL